MGNFGGFSFNANFPIYNSLMDARNKLTLNNFMELKGEKWLSNIHFTNELHLPGYCVNIIFIVHND